jgi:hypothetical protein
LVLSGATVLTKQDLDATQARGAEAPENDSQEQTPGSAPENLVGPIAQPAELTPENMKSLAKYAVRLGTRR